MDQSKHSETHHDQPGHELRDVTAGTVSKFIGGLAVLTIIALLAMWGLFKYFNARQVKTALPAAAQATGPRVPPEPRLQVTPETDLEKLRAAEDERLNSYGWVSREAEIVHIPIERAMDLVAERGLPVRDESKSQKEEGERQQ